MAQPPLRPQLKRLRDVTLNELAYIASPAFALSKLQDKSRTINGIPAGLQPAQIENGEWVLVCDTPWSRLMSPAFLYAKNLKHWAVHANINGPARIPFQLHITTLAPVMLNKPRSSSGAAGTTSKPKHASSPEDYPTETVAIRRTTQEFPAAPRDVNAKVDTTATTGDPAADKTKKMGEPISMISGEELLTLDDVTLPGPVPFVWQRLYRTSRSEQDIGLGHGWVHPGQSTLTLNEHTIDFIADDGRTITFRRPSLGGTSQHLHEGLTLIYETDTRLLLRQAGQPTKVFVQISEHTFRLSQWRHKAYVPSKMHIGIPTAARGYTLDFHYDPKGRLQRVQGNWGKGLVIERNDQGRIAALYQTNHEGQQRDIPAARYTYDTAGDLIAHHNAAGHGEQYAYTNHVITQRTLATGYAFYFEWDQLNKKAKCVKQGGDHGNYAYTFAWDEKNQRSSATNSLGNTTQFKYNRFGLITEEIDPEGHVHTKEYNDAGSVIADIDPLRNKTEYAYNKEQHLLSVTNPLKQRTQYGYDKEIYDEAQRLRDYTHKLAEDEITVVVDAHRQVWKRYYTAQNLVQRVVDPLGNTTRYEYTPAGLLRQVTDPDGRITAYTWNERAELIAQTDPLNNTLHYSYDDWGQIVEVIAQAAGQSLEHAKQHNATRYDYTPTGLIATVTHADNQITAFEYNENDQLTQYTDPHGRTTQYFYEDKLRQPTKRIDPAGHVIRYQYDTERNLTALINENGDTHQFFYDGNERLIKEIGFDGRTQHYQYNAAGHLIQHLDSGEVITTFERDALGQLVTKASRLVSDDKDTHRERARYQYNAVGQLIETFNAHQFLQFSYDPQDRLLQESHTDIHAHGLSDTSAITAHQYNVLGRRHQTTLPDGQTIDYRYASDSAELESVAVNGQVITTVQRDRAGREVSRAQGALTTQTEYDPQGRLQKKFTVHKDNQHHIIQREYGYDQFSNLNHIKDGNDETKYVYDTLNRLKLATAASSEFFAFDPAGNLLSITDSPTSTPGLVKGNRLLIQGDKKFEYDARGNLIQETRGKDGKLKKTFHYNLQNQLIKVETHSAHETVTYKYDPLGRRIQKTDKFGTTTFLWTDNLLAQETRDKIKKTYVFEPGSFRPLAQTQDDKVYHYHLDHVGTPRELTNDEGKIVWKARYKTYGNLALKEVEEVENNLRFQGQYFDEETGLHYNRFRYYSPESGQFINQDPIGLLGGLNNYQYAPNPVQWIDPLGLCNEEPSKTIETDKFGNIISREPKSIQDKMTLEAAMRGEGIVKIDSLGDSRYLGMQKMELEVISTGGKKSSIHYVRDPITNDLMDFKFKSHSTDYIHNYEKIRESGIRG